MIAVLLAYVKFGLQPQIDGAFAAGEPPISGENAQRVSRLRLRRKRLASTCLLSVLLMVMLGVQVVAPFPAWLTAAFVLLIVLFVWRAFRTPVAYGWL